MTLRDKVVLYPIDPGAGADRTTRVIRALRLAKPSAVVLVVNLPPDAYAARIPSTAVARTAVDL